MDGGPRAGGGRPARRRGGERRGHRPPYARTARHGHDHRVGQQDRPPGAGRPGHRHASASAVIAAEVADAGFGYLKAPIKQVTALDTPIPYSKPMEEHVLPSEDRIVA